MDLGCYSASAIMGLDFVSICFALGLVMLSLGLLFVLTFSYTAFA